MKKAITILILASLVASSSCGKKIASPNPGNVSIHASDHILPGYHVTSITFDSNGTAWIGTFQQGLIEYDGSPAYHNSANSVLPDSMVIWDLAVDRNDDIWIGSGVGLIRYREREFTLHDGTNSPLPEDVVWAIAADHDNSLWLASCRFRQGGLVKVHGEEWTAYTPDNSDLPSNSVRDIVVDSGNNVWIAMNETVNNACMVRISGDHWSIFGEEDMGFSPYYFGTLAVGNEGIVYASLDYMLSSLLDMTRPNIVKYDGEAWTIINPVDEHAESLGYVRKICVDLTGNLWASLSGRKDRILAVYDGSEWAYNDPDMPTDSVFEVAVDRNNTVWLGTGDGILLIGQ